MYLFVGLGLDTAAGLLSRRTWRVMVGAGALVVGLYVTSVFEVFSWMHDPLALPGRLVAIGVVLAALALGGRRRIVWGGLVVLSLFIAVANVVGYFEWMRQPYLLEGRGPAVELHEFDQWRACQKADVAAGRLGFSAYEWHASRPGCPR
jgi:hypothetical protein